MASISAPSFHAGSGARGGVALVDLDDRRLLWHVEGKAAVALVFSGDSKKLASIGSDGFFEYNVADGSRTRSTRFRAAEGVVGVVLKRENGKLLIKSVDVEKNPTLADQVLVGDELIAVNDGPAPEHYDDRREWTQLVGKSVDVARKSLGGRPGTKLRLRLARRGTPGTVEVELKRQWPSQQGRRLP